MLRNVRGESLTLDDLFRQCPPLSKAYYVVRDSRAPDYFRAWDQFTQEWVRPLAIPVDVGILAGANLGSGIDKVFEAATTGAALKTVSADFQALTDLNTAARYLDEMGRALYQAINFDEAVRIHLALITSAGYAQLRQNGAGARLADLWLASWQQKVLDLASQHVAQSRLTLAAEVYVPEQSNDLEAVVNSYLAEFGETGVLAVPVTGAFAFSQAANLELLHLLLDLLMAFTPLIRLAADLAYDPDEQINLPIVALAAGNNLTIADAAQLVRERTGETIDVLRRLNTLTSDRLAELQRLTGEMLEATENPEVARRLEGFSKVLVRHVLKHIGRAFA